mmetsp:Transcript_14867/g.62717  ORF Transcript_14867/g.62717 Transcript_14867/m.62717 type:complete len:237 (+) Transcript_14867:213-923(+)
MDLLSSSSRRSACCFRRRSSMVLPAPSGSLPSSPSSSSRSTLSRMSRASTAATCEDHDSRDSDVAKGCESPAGRPAVAFGSRFPVPSVIVTGIHGGISPSSRGLGLGRVWPSPSRTPPYHPLPSRPLREASAALYLSAAVSRAACSVRLAGGAVLGLVLLASTASRAARSIASAAARSRSISASSCARTLARSAASSALVRSAAAIAARRISSASRAAISSRSAASALTRVAAIRC